MEKTIGAEIDFNFNTDMNTGRGEDSCKYIPESGSDRFLLKDSRTVIFSALSGGCGCSFIASSISAYLARNRTKNILFLDLQAGKKDSRIIFNISGDIIRDLGDISCDFCDMDLSVLKKLVINLDSSLNIILPPLKFERVNCIINERLPALIEILSCYFDLIIVDFPHYLFFSAGSAADRFDKIILVSQADQVSICNLDNFISNLEGENASTKFEVIINKFNSKSVLSPAKITNTVKFPVKTFIPYDRDIDYLYRTSGPAAIFNYSLRIVRSLKDFADNLYDDLGF